MKIEYIRSEISEIIKQRILLYELPEFSEDSPLGENGLGLDSMSFLKLLNEVEKTFDIVIDDDNWDYKKLNTISKLSAYVNSCLEEGVKDGI